jgi:hypothetical protein
MKYIYFGFFAAIAALFVAMLVFDAQLEKDRKACEARGGRLMHFEDSYECIDRGAFR